MPPLRPADDSSLNTQPTASAPNPNSSLNLIRQHGLPTTLPPAPSLKRNYNLRPPPSSSAAQPLPIQHNLSFLPPAAHAAYKVLRNQHHLAPRPPLPPLPSHARAPATTPSKPLDSFDLDGLFPTADDIMLLQNRAFGFQSFAAAPADLAPPSVAADGSQSQQAAPALLDEPFAQPPYDFTFFEEDPTPNLDYSPLTSFSASPEWAAQPLFGDAGKEAGVVDDSPLFAAEDSFDFDFSGPSLFGDAPLFPPSKSAEPPAPTPSAFAALEATLAHLPVNPALTLPQTSPSLSIPAPAATPAVAPTSAVFSPSVASASLFPPSPHRQSSSPFPIGSARPPPAARRTSAPTGHRKGVQPEQLLDLDAPTQARSYIAPSATSRKRLPAAFEGRAGKTKKRKSAQETAEDEADAAAAAAAAADDAEGPPADLADSIEAKRRQNTLAARRSRIRKLEHVKSLETSVERLTAERAQLLAFAELAMALHPELGAVDAWGARVAMLRADDEAESGVRQMAADDDDEA